VPCSYRIAQEGLPLLLPRISRQRLTLSSADFMRLLTERMLLLPASAQPPQPAPAPVAAPAAGLTDDAELSDGGQPDADAAAVGAASGTAAAADGSAAPGSSAAGGGSAPGEAAAGSKGGAEAAQAAQQAGGGGGGGSQPKSDKPRGPPLDDEATLAQLADIGNGCCVATLRWGRSLACDCYLDQLVKWLCTPSLQLAQACWLCLSCSGNEEHCRCISPLHLWPPSMRLASILAFCLAFRTRTTLAGRRRPSRWGCRQKVGRPRGRSRRRRRWHWPAGGAGPP
jgi:hypothetical protein